ncbi:putative tetratricopeptide-like helical domain-containing protein [Lupinus albus]|uniref:Putative tetratricopeptide-like helical domain-containing protein n=1 Tax=Lupinus albus TaxID=3870 RepID=A0A6A4P5H9_LUPAL|nr:putative tetratricopeptide-like helical domain-containing protein [Lupinus albus]
MSEIDSAISNLEYSRATALLDSTTASSSSSSSAANTSESDRYDARMADEAYKAGCAALASGKLDEALRSLNLSLSKCPPDKISAVSKLNSLISLTSIQLQRSAN